MPSPARRVALLCLDPWQLASADHRPFNYAVRRIQAAILGDPRLAHLEVALIESSSLDVDAIVARIEAFDPDVLGVSAYVWSFPTLLEACRRAKRARPERTVVFGGPSSRPEVFQLPQHRDGAQVVDAIVIGEGEEAIRDILLLPEPSRASLLGLRGLSVHTGDAWTFTGDRTLAPPDSLPSPYQMGLMPQGITCQIESFRGCPLSCTFCEWGDTGVTARVFGHEHLRRELEALRTVDARGSWLVDPALNLSSRAFKNLQRAESETGVLATLGDFRCEIYPSHLTDDHLRFLESVQTRYVGIGLQSFDPEVLAGVERPFDAARFARVVSEVASIVPDTVIEVILGLPGDDPATFRRTVERVRELPVAVRVFHCLVLPGALMTRSPASFDLTFDPFTLQMISCRGWTREQLEETRRWLDDFALREDGDIPHGGTWKFPRPGTREAKRSAPASALTSARLAVPGELHDALARRVHDATGWRLDQVSRVDADPRHGLVLALDLLPGSLSLRVTLAEPAQPSYRTAQGIAYSYAGTGGTHDTKTLRALDRAIERIHPLMTGVLLGVGAHARKGLPLLADSDGPAPTSQRVRSDGSG